MEKHSRIRAYLVELSKPVVDDVVVLLRAHNFVNTTSDSQNSWQVLRCSPQLCIIDSKDLVTYGREVCKNDLM